MQGILMDNWSIQNIITRVSEDDRESYNKEYIDLLEAIVLWDNLYYPENANSSWWKYVGQDHSIKKIIKPIQNDEMEFSIEIEEILKDVNNANSFTETVNRGAVKYLLFSNKNGLNYFPCEKRCIFLQQSNLFDNINHISRFEIIGSFDKEIMKYYMELNDFFGKNVFSFEIPLLADFILQNTPNNMSHIDYAIKLREDRHVVAYRKYLNEIEIAINSAQWDKLLKFEQETKGLVKDIFEGKELIDSISMNLLALPSFSISIANLPFKKNIHLSFLRKLGKFAYKERKYNYKMESKFS